MKKLCLASLLSASAAMLMLSGCAMDPDAPLSTKDQIKEINNRFDFNCWKDIPVSISVSRPAVIKIYDCDPTTNKNAIPLAEVTTDKDGKYKGNINMGAGNVGEDLWAVATDMCIKTTVNAKGANFVETKSRAISEFGVKGACETLDRMYHDMLPEGNTNVDDMLEQSITVAQNKDINIHTTGTGNSQIMVSMIDHGDALPVQLYYYYYKTGTDDTNAGRLNHFKNTFSAGPVAFYNTFHQEKFRIKPDDDVTMNRGWNNDTHIGASKMLKFYGENYDQEASEDFPSGYTIGFILYIDYKGDKSRIWYETTEHGIGAFLINPTAEDNATMWRDWDHGTAIHDTNGLGDDNTGPLKDYAGCYNVSNKVTWPQPATDEEFGMEGETVKNWSSTMSRLLYGFEDYPGGFDRDYNDLMFLTTVYGDIKNNIPEWGSNTIVKSGTYLFEDLYPNAGDYDMNDVIVHYTYKAKYQKVDDVNKVTSFEYTITPVWDGAEYKNDFYIEYVPVYGDAVYKCIYTNNRTQIGKIFKGFARLGDNEEILSACFTCQVTDDKPQGEEIEGTRVNNDVFAAAFIGQDPTDLFTRTSVYEEGVGEQGIPAKSGINPFLLVTNTGYEVHLTGYRQSIAKVGNCDESNLFHKYYFTDLSKNKENLPFALDIPTMEFEPATEKTPIYMEYKFLVPWIASHGLSTFNNWYRIKEAPETPPTFD